MTDAPVRKYQRILIEDDIESPENYEPGGFHPVDLFDVLDERFEVIYKLGFGGIATAWLCYEFQHKWWRAVKINAASHSSDECPDLKILRIMREKNMSPEDLLSKHIAVPLETFWLEGPNGRHLCSVMPVLGPRLSEWRLELGTDFDSVDKICHQFTEGLGFLHGMGIAHGDFRPANILTKLKSQCLDDIGVEEMKDLLDAPEMEEVLTLEGERSVHAPEFIVTGVGWNRMKHLISDDIAIVDFGESYEINNPPSSLGIPKKYAAPEIFFEQTPTLASDIWSLAFTLIEFRLKTNLAATIPSIIWRMERFAGSLPNGFRPDASRMLEEARGEPLDVPPKGSLDTDFDRQPPITENLEKLNMMNKRLGEGTPYTDPLEIILGAKYTLKNTSSIDGSEEQGAAEKVSHRLSTDEVATFADLLRKMFKYPPGERMGASEALRHDWFKRFRVKNDARPDRKTAVIPPLIVIFGVYLCIHLIWIVTRWAFLPQRSNIPRIVSLEDSFGVCLNPSMHIFL